MATGGTDVRAALDAATAGLRATLPERAAVRRYQSTAGTHLAINRLLRGSATAPGTARAHVETVLTLDGLLARSALPLDVTVYRGVASLRDVVPVSLPATRVHAGYVSTTLRREIAVEEFEARAGALLRIVARPGLRGVWVPPLGDQRLAYEEEVLFCRGTFLTFFERRIEDGLIVVDCEVTG